MNSRHTFSITVKLRGPILTKSSSPSSFGVDSAVARIPCGPDEGKPCLPGTLIRGKVRESLCQLWTEVEADNLLGKESPDNSDNEPSRGKLILGDLVHSESRVRSKHRHRIAIEPELGSVKSGALQVIECPFAAGEEVYFTGHAWFYGDEKAAKDARNKLQLSLRWLCQIGANRTSGFGEMLEAVVEDTTDPPGTVKPTSFSVAPDSLAVGLNPSGPLCIAKHKIGDNLFESEAFIPGNMLAGAVMETAAALGLASEAFKAAFNQIRFRHAYPTTCSERPGVLPLSLVKVGKYPLYDVAELREPCLLKNSDGQFQAPAFMVDWKSFSDAEQKYGIAWPERELRVRTRIDSSKRTADRGENGEGGKLFAWEVVHPYDENSNPITWRTCIDLSNITDDAERLQAANNLAKVLAQLGFLSKTKALCSAEVTAPPPPTSPQLSQGQTLRLTLQSPALLVDPRFQDVPSVPKHGALSATELFRLYEAVWSKLSGGGLTLSHYYAQQSLAGGNYLAIRYQKKKREKYDPWLLTNAGSVFIFKITDATKAQQNLARWLKTGLPLPAWAKEAFGDQWNENPYIPQNGFGEIALHEFRFAPPAEPKAISNLATPILP